MIDVGGDEFCIKSLEYHILSRYHQHKVYKVLYSWSLEGVLYI